MVRTAASSNGEQKNALAACERWCSLKRMRSGAIPSFVWSRCFIQSLSPSHVTIASRNTLWDFGNVCRLDRSSRSNFTNGFSKKTT